MTMEVAIELEGDVVVAGKDLWGNIVLRGAGGGGEYEVQLSAKGVEHVDVRAEEFSHENVFLSKVVLEEKVRLDASGEATLPFTACFPESSCCNSFSYQHRLGYDAGVKYSLRCTVRAAVEPEEPLAEADRSVTVLEAHGKRSHPIVVKEKKNNMWTKGFVEVSMVVAKNAHCKGSAIPVRLVVDNRSGKVITGVTLTLRRRLLFQVPGKFRKEQVTEGMDSPPFPYPPPRLTTPLQRTPQSTK